MRKTEFAVDNFYHIFNRGVDKRIIFIDDYDRWRFLLGLFLFNDENAPTNALWQAERNFKRITFGTIRQFLDARERKPIVRINAYCLMPNHYHLFLEEITPGGISKFMQKFGTGYTMYFNKKFRRTGSLFQGTFKSIMAETQEQLEFLLFYINVINPAQIVEPNFKESGLKNLKKTLSFVNQYPWSTHQEYLNLRKSVIIDKGLLGEIFENAERYKEYASAILLSKQFNSNYNSLNID